MTEFIAIVTIETDGPTAQEALLDLLAKDVEEWVRHVPGFVSANYHLSLDGTRVVNYARWETEQAYRDSFKHNPRAGTLREAIAAVPGVRGGPQMTGYHLARSIPAAATESV